MNAAEHLETLFKETSADACTEMTFVHHPGVLNDLCVTELLTCCLKIKTGDVRTGLEGKKRSLPILK